MRYSIPFFYYIHRERIQPEMEIVNNKAIFTINVKNEELVRIEKTINPDNFRENSVPN